MDKEEAHLTKPIKIMTTTPNRKQQDRIGANDKYEQNINVICEKNT